MEFLLCFIETTTFNRAVSLYISQQQKAKEWHMLFIHIFTFLLCNCVQIGWYVYPSSSSHRLCDWNRQEFKFLLCVEPLHPRNSNWCRPQNSWFLNGNGSSTHQQRKPIIYRELYGNLLFYPLNEDDGEIVGVRGLVCIFFLPTGVEERRPSPRLANRFWIRNERDKVSVYLFFPPE